MTPEQSALLRKATESIQAAQLLSSQKFYDFAVSRAYYAMFYVAQAILLGEGYSFSKHSTVISQFGQHFAKTGRVPVKYHRYLIDAQDSRLLGDYSAMTNLSAVDADEAIDRAQEFVDLAQDVIGPQPTKN